MAEVPVLTEAQLREAVTLDAALVDAIEDGFRALAAGGVVMPPVVSMAIAAHRGEVDVKTAYVPGLDGFAIKVSPGFFDNPAQGLPSLTGLMVLLSARTGMTQAVFLDNGYLTDLRTAAAGAVAARHLAPATVETAGVIGTGVQARLQMRAAFLERPFRHGLVWGRDREKAVKCAADLSGSLGIGVDVATDVVQLVARSQLVVTATPSTAPLITAEMLHDGLHITAMGADQAEKTEIAPEALAAAQLYVCDRVSQCETLGELRAARAAGLMLALPPELGQIVAGAVTGRTDPRQITICDLTGTGVQDTVIAAHVARRLAAGPAEGGPGHVA
ncbi:cyclodeaminase [Celeribacter indicus]|uniref:Ectoine utilization protein EutC n=1 Tax=Celeribacter indicus TaxID=1208324 RepID=A0A0B5DXM8_9RHOB|nr:cyclodeaminase [Celeribacter indicus]AJE45870.1 ectoine utilization protein EutC [Celeribacter indicus]SDW62641.1 ornithine cyclodeaminase [Celeribacter indicus]